MYHFEETEQPLAILPGREPGIIGDVMMHGLHLFLKLLTQERTVRNMYSVNDSTKLCAVSATGNSPTDQGGAAVRGLGWRSPQAEQGAGCPYGSGRQEGTVSPS